ncbi:ubiquitin-activating enzyme E1 [Strigomonas culicis]|uniref:Ubiquitin-activating enzyme E1 n=1 Tax=Strigomonas culicis TaxID=28005 RepID=S9W017_9TRYP|nr:ubiquitin-activating enzyme E1 [Strigomonas culicis]|eukprot:EPY29245.1 ubiquitin-activating enzyme E1 [Strigomonas culicis]
MASIESQKHQLYNRQEYVVGAETQAKYGSTTVLVVGACGLGAEIIKNLVLTGVKAVQVLDERPVAVRDLSTNFFLQEGDVGKPIGDVVAAAAKELNRFVAVTAVKGDVLQLIPGVQVVVFANSFTANLIAANEVARKHQVRFVSCESRGIAGCVFTDGGDAFEVVDTNGEETVSCVVTALTKDGLVTLHDDKSHECEVGSKVYFTGVESPAAVNSEDPATVPRGQTPQLRLFEVREVVSPFILQLKGLAEAAGSQPLQLGAGSYLHTTKTRTTMAFDSLARSLERPDYNMVFDSEAKLLAPMTLHAVFRAVAKAGAAPRTAAELASAVAAAQSLHPDLETDVAEKVLAVFAGDLNPMAAFIGGIASQEALKLCSGKFTPLHQWLYYDAREVLEARGGSAAEWLAAGAPRNSRYDGQTAVLGLDFQTYLAKQRAFIVGAGALGCELIKNVALMGIGGVSITDMDSIEMSNLSRQFLFRNHHIGRPKSTVAAEAARAINGSVQITSHEAKMAPETEGVFNEAFWLRHSVVLNALDNVQSRKYVDERCLFYKAPLFESGTLGTKCNMQPVIPYVTESYSSSQDPPEKSIPLCTLKNFPSAIEHTIQWARDQFHLLFHSTPGDANSYLKDPQAFAEALRRDPAASPAVLKNVNEALRQWPTSDRDCVRRARIMFHENFNESFKQLLHNLPLDKRNEDGQLFWSGAKRPPAPQEFDSHKERDAAFVYHTACLVAAVYGIPMTLTPAQAAEVAAKVEVPSFVARQVTFATSEADKKDPSVSQLAGDLQITDLPPPTAFAGRCMHPLEFEKDDPTNHHVEFITYCSNTRAEAYAIPPADLVRTKRIAGKIIPAMVTTTSLVTGLVGFEVLKYLLLQQRHGDRHVPSPKDVTAQLSLYRSAFVNIALPLFAFSDPIIAAGRSYALPSGGSVRWTAWDRLDINEGRDISVNELVRVLETKFHIDVFMVTLTSGKMIFSQFGGKKEEKAKPVSEVAQLKGEVPQEGNDYLNLIATGTIGDEEDVDIPVIRYKYRGF